MSTVAVLVDYKIKIIYLAAPCRGCGMWTLAATCGLSDMTWDLVPWPGTICVCAQSCLTLLWPHGPYPPDSSVHGIILARILERVAISYSKDYLVVWKFVFLYSVLANVRYSVLTCKQINWNLSDIDKLILAPSPSDAGQATTVRSFRGNLCCVSILNWPFSCLGLFIFFCFQLYQQKKHYVSVCVCVCVCVCV